jgi:hypothetical protein
LDVRPVREPLGRLLAEAWRRGVILTDADELREALAIAVKVDGGTT